MRVFLRARGVHDDGLGELVNRRAAVALGRFSSHVTSVTVRLEDLNGPRGGVDKRCSLEVTGTFGERVVEARDQTFRTAIDRAFATMQRCLVRAIQRQSTEQRLSRGVALHCGPSNMRT
jgi:hypothetical protein